MGYRLPFSNGIHCFPPSILRQLVGKLPVYWLHLIDFHRIIRLQHETGAKIFFNIKAVLFVIVRQIPVILMLADVIFIREERPDTTKLQDTFSAVHNCYFILAHQLFATMSSDELKKSVAKRLLVLQRSINLIQFIRLQIQHFISAFCFFMGNLL